MGTIEERADRASQVRTERRRKPGDTVLSGLQLHVPEDALDRKHYEYRWVNDTPGRVERLYGQDWDPVEDKDASIPSDGEGTAPKKHVGIINGQPTRAVLMRKPKAMYDEDFKAKQKPLDEIEAAIRRGTAHKASGETELTDGVTYTPGVNTIDR